MKAALASMTGGTGPPPPGATTGKVGSAVALHPGWAYGPQPAFPPPVFHPDSVAVMQERANVASLKLAGILKPPTFMVQYLLQYTPMLNPLSYECISASIVVSPLSCHAAPLLLCHRLSHRTLPLSLCHASLVLPCLTRAGWLLHRRLSCRATALRIAPPLSCHATPLLSLHRASLIARRLSRRIAASRVTTSLVVPLSLLRLSCVGWLLYCHLYCCIAVSLVALPPPLLLHCHLSCCVAPLS